MKTILITGGAGFIGSNFVRLLKSTRRFNIVIVDKLTYAGSHSTIEDVLDKHCRFIHGDIADPPLVGTIFRQNQFDYVVNFAAESHVDRSIENSSIFIQSNVIGVQVLLEACRQFGIQKFLQISTDEVYGELGTTGLFTENSPLKPSSPYSASKASADLLVQAWHKTYGLPMNITRCSNNYGPYQYPEKLIPLMITKALNNEPLPIYGDGTNIRDWIHVEDHCQALLVVLEQGQNGRTYNIGGNSEHSNLFVVHSILRYLEKPNSLIELVTDRLGHDWRYAIDNTRINNELGWCPQHTFKTGLEQTIEWYTSNSSWSQSHSD